MKFYELSLSILEIKNYYRLTSLLLDTDLIQRSPYIIAKIADEAVCVEIGMTKPFTNFKIKEKSSLHNDVDRSALVHQESEMSKGKILTQIENVECGLATVAPSHSATKELTLLLFDITRFSRYQQLLITSAVLLASSLMYGYYLVSETRMYIMPPVTIDIFNLR
jgi:hypothetical protein